MKASIAPMPLPSTRRRQLRFTPFLVFIRISESNELHASFLIYSVFDARKRALSLNKNRIEVLWWVYVALSVTTSSESTSSPSGSKRVAVVPSFFLSKIFLPPYHVHLYWFPFFTKIFSWATVTY